MLQFDPGTYTAEAIRRHAEGFGAERFRTAMTALVRDAVANPRPR
jgi:hypothetical protein